MKEQATTSTVTVKYKTEKFETWKSLTFTTADEDVRKRAPGRGKRVKVRFELLGANAGLEIESFAWEIEQRAVV